MALRGTKIPSKFYLFKQKRFLNYHSCKLLFMILLQHNVAGDGCLCLKFLYILKPSLHSSGPQLH